MSALSWDAAIGRQWDSTRITIVIPTYNEAANLPGMVEALLALGLPDLQILVVDDNRRYRSQLPRMIAKLYPQATIFEAENIRDAYRLAESIQPHLDLIDVVLGDEDGISCARRIRTVCAKCRIILISAYPDREFHHQGLKSGAVAFLDKKDLDLASLRQVIYDVIA